MKFTSYARRIHGDTAFVHGGSALDLDWGGGLEEVLEGLMRQGVRRIVLTLGTMKFLHATLFATLLSTQRKLEAKGGDLVLAEVPWFVEQRLQDLGVAHRFAQVPNARVVERAQRLRVDLNSDPATVIPG